MKNIITVIGATIAASLCCVTPVLAVLAGSSSLASSFSWLAPYHNYLVVFTILVLVYAWYDKLKRSKALDCACDESSFFAGKTFLAMVTVFVVVMLSFPQWGNKVFSSAPTAQSCAIGACDTNITEKPVTQTVNIDDLPVLKYMSDEEENPTACGQVACAGTGYSALDDMMAQARRDVQEMSPAVLKKMIDNEDAFILLDVREVIQHAEGEIYADEMLAIPRTNLEFEILNAVKDRAMPIVLYSRMGARSLFAAQSLQKLGYTHVYNLSAGLKGWVRAQYPYDNGLGTVLKVVDAQ
ncbi:rhodanese-like domain-containing protein [Sulfurimonas sp.]|jgi:rhodanese-related sulfurtransferase|uniref:rhodanese-like domain-containing protein n=1 Tax=Sulfurimonas sp. TaxID=2022749 RepID=UPI0025EF0E00|nr:rhodanese-like domain-containing protein [Sulfurimonas sp.]MBT5933931.1 rhodanese-like domain-containing protein [Sulfurimonas sp.]